jgi:NAD(P)-dependent dehydrogenase (short-subunit alcohol dehydrogenase family)
MLDEVSLTAEALNMGKLDGRVAIITGGSGGIGRAAAKRFVDEGANVLLVDIEERTLRDSINAIGRSMRAGYARTLPAMTTRSGI